MHFQWTMTFINKQKRIMTRKMICPVFSYHFILTTEIDKELDIHFFFTLNHDLLFLPFLRMQYIKNMFFYLFKNLFWQPSPTFGNNKTPFLYSFLSHGFWHLNQSTSRQKYDIYKHKKTVTKFTSYLSSAQLQQEIKFYFTTAR
jgi:hypothetical protein